MIVIVEHNDTPDYRDLVRDAARSGGFRHMTVSAPLDPRSERWAKITLRPVALKDGRFIQCVYYSREKSVTQNYAGAEFERRLDEILSSSFSRIEVQTDAADLHIRVTKKGRVLVSRGAPSRPRSEPAQRHDRVKKYPMAAEGPDAFLRRIGIKNERGEVLPSMQAKFRQVNAFIGLIDPLLQTGRGDGPIRLVDCGCGSAHLTFAVYHYIAHVRKMSVELTGIDRKADLIGKCCALRDELGWSGLTFEISDIASFRPAAAPDIVFSLHACDTATDDAVAQAVRWGSRAIVAAPCCQHELHHRIAAEPFNAVLRHGILRERMADILTDAFRALALRVMGYRAEVVEFVAPEYTPKNLVLRAEKVRDAGEDAAAQEYQELKRFWNVTPAIETMLGEAMAIRMKP